MTRASFIRASLALLSVFSLGFLGGRWMQSEHGVMNASSANLDASAQVFTCSMHPQVRLDRPGNCPICAMPLILATGDDSGGSARPTLTLSSHAVAMAGVETVAVTFRELRHELRAVGKIQYNEPSLATVTARVDGYAERLFVNVTGVDIKAGDHLLEAYSPDLFVAQQELLIALQDPNGGPLVDAARLKLLRWGLTQEQIGHLVDSRKFADRVTFYSPIAGTVIEKTIVENSAFKAGDVLYRVANLDTVWAYLDIYEFDLPWIRYGQAVRLETEAHPGQIFEGMVTFVEPVLNDETRTVRVPIHIENANHALKPGMFVSAVISAELGPDGRAAATGVEGKFACRMHPQILKDQAGICQQCGMELAVIPGSTTDAMSKAAYACPMKCEAGKVYGAPGNCPVCQMALESNAPVSTGSGLLAIPVSAVLDSGTRSIVYVDRGMGSYEAREVTLGPRCDEYIPVLRGLIAGERVVTQGGFLIDSQFQITGHPSLFYPGGLHAAMGHVHEGAGSENGDSRSVKPAEPAKSEVPPAGGHKH
ncbi:MAG: efflux RND transporter periplasmic adaptor subunit [Planctomycetes bacterium]|nr:efflux RND transporter periplasmic adaptor subunit [Planctomycetota bacterium]